MKVTTSTVFECAPSELWRWIDEPDRCKQWLRGLEDVQPVSTGPKRPGHETKLFIREGRRLQEYLQTIVEHVPERRFKMRMQGGCLGGSTMTVDYVLVDLKDGRTRLDYECSAEMKGVLRLFAPFFAVFGRMQVRSFFKKLKELAEGRGLASAGA